MSKRTRKNRPKPIVLKKLEDDMVFSIRNHLTDAAKTINYILDKIYKLPNHLINNEHVKNVILNEIKSLGNQLRNPRKETDKTFVEFQQRILNKYIGT